MRDFASATDGDWLQERAAELALALALAPAFAWLSPFGFEEPPFGSRMGFWAGVMACWFMAVALTDRWLMPAVRLPVPDPRLRQAAVIGLAALPMVPVTGGALDLIKGWQASLSDIAELYLQIVVLGSMTLFPARAALQGLARLRSGAHRREPVRPAAHVPARAPSASAGALMARLPPETRGPLLCLEMQDHYVCVHTERGTALVLMRLRDAIAETAPTPGRQVHRSWWVSDGAVERYARTGRTGALHLGNGLTVPVSQRYLRDVEAAYAQAPRAPAGPDVQEVGVQEPRVQELGAQEPGVQDFGGARPS